MVAPLGDVIRSPVATDRVDDWMYTQETCQIQELGNREYPQRSRRGQDD